ncbi:MAG: hypothetical protein PHR30_06800 [Gallionellaceae bacterium]|nr:hypothetical protein [Gallionellaceae bacterium]
MFLRHSARGLSLAAAVAIAGCASVGDKQKSAWNPLTGGYVVMDVAPDIYLIHSKSAPFVPRDYPETPDAKLMSWLLGGRLENARKNWPGLARAACGGGYREYDVVEYASQYSTMPYQVIAVRSAYAICNQGHYSDEAVIRLLKP